MRLYTTTGATQVDDPEHGTFVPDASGAFEFPDAMASKLHGRPGWETDAVREQRIVAEELERFRDPATLLAEVKKMAASQGAVTSLLAQALGLAPAAPAEGVVADAPVADASGTAGSVPDGGESAPVESGQVTAESDQVSKAVAGDEAPTKTTRSRGGKAAKAAASETASEG